MADDEDYPQECLQVAAKMNADAEDAVKQVDKWHENQELLLKSKSPVYYVPLVRPLIEKFATTVGVSVAMFPDYWGYFLAGLIGLILVVWSYSTSTTPAQWFVCQFCCCAIVIAAVLLFCFS